MTIELHTWNTPNGRKISVALEEMGLPYKVFPVNITKGEQMAPAFLKISPNNKIPAIVDPEGPDGRPMSLFESGAILVYLAGKTGRFLPADVRGKYVALQWLMFQMGGVGPMFGQVHHFLRQTKEPVPYAIERYTKEKDRLYAVLDKRLGEAEYLAGDEYTIADIAIMPWLRVPANQGVDAARFPNYRRWFDEIGARPAVQRGLAVLSDVKRPPPDDPKWRENLFGSTQYQQR